MQLRAAAACTVMALTLSAPFIASAQAPVVVFNPVSVTGSVSPTAQIRLASLAPAEGLVFQLSSDNPAVKVPGTVTVKAGASSANFGVTTIPVARPTTVVIAFAAPGLSNTARLTVLPPELSAVTLLTSVTGGSDKPAQAKLTGPAATGGFAIKLSSSNPSVARVQDEVSVGAAATEVTFNITVVPVAQITPITISAKNGASSASAQFQVIPPSISRFKIPSIPGPGSTTVQGGYGDTNLTCEFTLTAPAPAGLTVELSSSNPTVASVPPVHTFPAGATTSTIPITTIPVAQFTEVVLTARLGIQTLPVTLQLLTPVISGLTMAPHSLIGGLGATGEVTLTGPAPAPGLLLSVGAIGPTNVSTPPSLIVATGQTSRSFIINTFETTQTDTAIVRVTGMDTRTGGQVVRTHPLIILAISPASLTLSRSTAYGSNGSLNGRVTLNRGAPAGGLSVHFSSSNPNVIVPPAITMPHGQTTSEDFGIACMGVTVRTTVTITATASGVSRTAQLVLNP